MADSSASPALAAVDQARTAVVALGTQCDGLITDLDQLKGDYATLSKLYDDSQRLVDTTTKDRDNYKSMLFAVQGQLDSVSTWFDNPAVKVATKLHRRGLFDLKLNPGGWQFASNSAGDTGGKNPEPPGHFVMTFPTDPTKPTNLQWNPGHAYNGGYAYCNVPEIYQPNLKRFRYDVWLSYDSQASRDGSQGVELEIEDCDNGEAYNGAYAYYPADTVWNTFFFHPPAGFTGKKWQPTDIALDKTIMNPGNVLHFASEFVRVDDHSMMHVALILNGTRYSVMRQYPSFPGRWGIGSHYLHAAVQLDSKNIGPNGALPPSTGVNIYDMQLRVL
jgi:hypothetical protein